MNRVADPDWHSRGEPLHHGGRGYYDDPQWDEPEEYPGYGEGQRMRSPPNGYSSDQASSLMNDGGPSYLLEHLATFRVAEESDLMYPADGMRRLLHMEKTTGIWTQRMQLKLERDWVMILSHENKDTVEKFPIQLIQEPTAYTSNDPRELYNNIFIFVVAEDPKGDYTNCTEMHIFQCLEISAKDIVEDMKMCMAGRWGNIPRHPETSGGMRRAPPPDKRSQPPSNGYNRAAPYLEAPMRGRRSPRSSVEGGPGGIDRGGDDASSVSSESYSRDVAILNCCFDDIERFIARLQHTAAATRELKKRQQSRKIKKNNIGDGLLSMRAKRPSTSEFEEILQKFKLSFNMLGKLRTYIHEPNAPELVHFLFTPLALIVDASRDDQPPPDTPAKVLSPLLTREAIDLLTNCLSSRETELWQSLGDPWTIPKEVWKYPVPPYQPVFSSGWAPELPEEGRDSRPESHKHHRQDMDDLYGGKRSSQSPSRYQRNPYPESDGSVSESGPEGPPGGPGTSMQWLNELRGRGARVVQVIYPRTANNEKELTVIRGEYLEVVDDSRKWWKCGNSRGLVAHVPHTIVTPYAADGPQEGMRSTGADWVRQERQGKKDSSSEANSTPTPKLPSRREATPTPIPEPPPMPPPDFTPGNTIADRTPKKKIPVNSKQLFGTNRQTGDLMNYELKNVLQEFRKRKPHIDVQKTPDVYVDNRATPKEVQQWLKKKNFSERVCKQFDGVDGAKLFSLSKKQLKSFCGESEGARLFSQITIQRNISGYKTTNTNELKRILQQQRKKTETDDAADVDKQFSFLDNQENADTSSEEEVIVVRKSKKSKEKKSKQRRDKMDSPSKSKSNIAQSQPSTSNATSQSPRAPSSSGIKQKSSHAKSSADTGTLKDQIKKQRMKIIYKTDDEETVR